mmetsp:Transcript_88104/g.156207  ORF Transcript_88104/g.156207 Transcript_88104/m.156207 type:complete len:124 (-) Transcript_88104:71-442(-)
MHRSSWYQCYPWTNPTDQVGVACCHCYPLQHSSEECRSCIGSEVRIVAGLDIEATSGTLWVLWSDGELQAFDLLRGFQSGSWRPKWPVPPVSLCASGQRGLPELLVLGRRPELLRAVLEQTPV